MKVRAIVLSIRMVALAVWIGGLIALGAIAAPLVFGSVPAPFSADAMTLVFRRFDRFAIACGAILLACEGWERAVKHPTSRLDGFRLIATAVATLLAVIEGVFISPKIAALHGARAIRGVGEAGLELESVHRWAEALAKGELLVLVGVVVLTAWAVPEDRVH